MKLIVGLGNPGSRYNFTRHNFGFLALDYYFKKHGLSWDEKPHFGAVAHREGNVWFIKPQDFYNESGRAVSEFLRYYKMSPSDVLVVCDNFDLAFGKIRYRSDGVAGGNNGLKSIDSHLGTSSYPRIRLGTWNDDLRHKIGDIDFVLSKFTPEEKTKLPEVLEEAGKRINSFIAE